MITYKNGDLIKEIQNYNEQIKDYLFLFYKTKEKKYIKLVKSLQLTINKLEEQILKTK